MQEFLDMGGYAFYVWTAYALALAVLALNWIVPKRALRSRWISLLHRARPATAAQPTAITQTPAKEAAA